MGRIKDKAAGIFAKIKSIKHIDVIIAVLAVVIMLFIYFGTSCSSDKKTGISQTGGEYDYYTETVRQLETKLSRIEGVGDVYVLVNWSTDGAEEGEFPKPEGVIIICDGGNDIAVKLKLISSVASYFGIDENKINVLAKGR